MDGAVKKYTHYRTAGYLLTILVQISNIVYMRVTLRGVVEKEWDDENIRTFTSLQGRYFTGWTVLLQVLHAMAGLVCESLILWNTKKKNYQLPKYLRGFRNTLFSAVVWPSILLVSTLFWTLYSIDRALIFPPFVDKILTSTSNHIIHTLIVPMGLWEIWYQPRVKPRSHFKHLGHLIFHMAVYLSVLIYTFINRDVWIYPVFGKLYGTIYFPIIFIVIVILLIIYYYIQWTLVYLIWGDLDKNKSKKIK